MTPKTVIMLLGLAFVCGVNVYSLADAGQWTVVVFALVFAVGGLVEFARLYRAGATAAERVLMWVVLAQLGLGWASYVSDDLVECERALHQGS